MERFIAHEAFTFDEKKYLPPIRFLMTSVYGTDESKIHSLPKVPNPFLKEKFDMMQSKQIYRKAKHWAIPGLIGMSLSFMACNEDKSTGPAKATPTITISSPTKGAVISLTGFQVKVKTTDFTYGKIGDANMDGSGHMHVYLDKPANSGAAYTAVITDGDTATVAGPLSAGIHYVIVTLQKNDHSPYNIQDSMSFLASATIPTTTSSVAFLSPTEGSMNGTSVTIKLSPINFKVVAPGAAKSGEGHFHYFLDGGTYVPLADTVLTLDKLSVGEHSLRVTLQNSDHSDLNVEKTLKFKVVAGMPNFTFAYPSEGATVGPVVSIQLSTTDFKLAAPGDLHHDEGHFHYFLDGGPYNALVDSTIYLTDLKEGDHNIRVTLQDNKHQDIALERTLHFKVGSSNPSFTFASPATGAMLGSSVTIHISPMNFKVAGPGPNLVTGEGHFHYFVDGGTYNALADTIFTLNNLSVGEHTVRVAMQDDKHGDLHVERSLKFIVSATAPSFTISSPKEGDTVSSPVVLKMAGKNFTVVAPGTVKPNEGHYHYFIDKGTYNALADTMVSIPALTPGLHTLRVTMQKGDHSDYGLEQSVSFTVK